MDSCCHDKACEVERLREKQSKTLWTVLFINAAMFVVEIGAGIIANSTALMADSLDMFGDALVYGLSLYVIAREDRWRNLAALLKGLIMALFGFGVLARCGYQIITFARPDAQIMGAIGFLALATNLFCLALLTRHRGEDLNMKSTWLCSRNDIVANTGVLLAATAVYFTDSLWPDVIISLVITAVFLKSATYVIRQSLIALKKEPVPG
jgi:cation diffusion facilitator family transporter